MADIAIIASDGSYHSSVGAGLDAFALVAGQVERMFARSTQLRMDTRVRLLSGNGRPVAMADGRSLDVDRGIREGDRFSLVHLPSFRVGGADELRERLKASANLTAWLRAQRNRGALVSASGTGACLLAAAGLLGHQAVPIPRALAPVLGAVFPRLSVDLTRPVVDHGDLVLGSGLAADQALMIHIVERIISPEMARWLDTVLGVGAHGSEQLAEDALVASAQIWIEQNFATDLRISELAAQLSTSHQTLIRRFRRAIGMAPRHYAQHLRIQAAQRMLTRTRRPIEQIAASVGYADLKSFREAFRARTGTAPSEYRRSGRDKL